MERAEIACLKREGGVSVKRIFDIAFSLLVILLTSPLFLLIALGIKCSSKGKVFYVQPRLGKGGKVFNCLKFRTMHENSDEILAEILGNPDIRREWRERQKLFSDPRIFSLGRILRKSSLDELPQFFNVIKGELSVVGPRPYMIYQLEAFGPLKEKILSVRPGITGLWQTSGRSLTTFQERIHLDASYVDRAGFWYDLRLILKTIPSLFFNQDAY